MKKTILIIIILLITTGCSCEYNLKIENNKYSEEVIIIANTNSEKNEFNKTWNVPIDKDTYNIGLDSETDGVEYGSFYDSELSGNRLIFSHDFNMSSYANSTAVSNCYNMLTVSRENGDTIISTSKEAKCFDDYPSLNSVTINITIDDTVVKHNADNVSGNTYTWNINKDNASNKSVDLIIKNSSNNSFDEPSVAPNSTVNNNENKRDYSTYILAAIIGLLVLLGYGIYIKMKNKEEEI